MPKNDNRESDVKLFFKYFPTYMDIKSNPNKREAMKNHPGVQWFDDKLKIIYVIVLILLAIFWR